MAVCRTLNNALFSWLEPAVGALKGRQNRGFDCLEKLLVIFFGLNGTDHIEEVYAPGTGQS